MEAEADVEQCGGKSGGRAGEHARPEPTGKPAGNYPAGAWQRGAVRQRPAANLAAEVGVGQDRQIRWSLLR